MTPESYYTIDSVCPLSHRAFKLRLELRVMDAMEDPAVAHRRGFEVHPALTAFGFSTETNYYTIVLTTTKSRECAIIDM